MAGDPEIIAAKQQAAVEDVVAQQHANLRDHLLRADEVRDIGCLAPRRQGHQALNIRFVAQDVHGAEYPARKIGEALDPFLHALFLRSQSVPARDLQDFAFEQEQRAHDEHENAM
ncbi:MAG TPA: hypothetical protein PKE04_11625 [Clostridia bacterium]|nr:hypothetical protein [Clostridia bacterium]